jgi:DNA-binding transcriptional ArsR family regulator
MAAAMRAMDVVTDPERVAAAISPIRRRLLSELVTPGSATTLGKRLGLTRQRVNYHMRELERAGLIELVGERPRRGLTERLYRATARSVIVDPNVLGVASTVDADRFSSAHLVGIAARAVREVAVLRDRAEEAGKPLATFTIDAEINLGTPDEFNSFAADLRASVAVLVERYHRPGKGRRHRVVATSYPVITKTQRRKHDQEP